MSSGGDAGRAQGGAPMGGAGASTSGAAGVAGNPMGGQAGVAGGGRAGAGGTIGGLGGGGSSMGGRAGAGNGGRGGANTGGRGGAAGGPASCTPAGNTCSSSRMCFCCPQGGPLQACFCSRACNSDDDCNDPAIPYCDTSGPTATGRCTPRAGFCCWACQ
jgi:hypothetical protein